jgi:hypothetical protein
MPTCIYCRAFADDTVFSREHVVPQAFGRFRDARYVTLIGVVCAGCNQYFGDQVEVHACRGSIEGMHRYQTGQLQSATSFVKGSNSSRISMEITDPGWEGVRAYQILAPAGDSTLVMFQPQVVIRTKGDGSARSYTVAELGDAAIDPADVADFRAYSTTDVDLDALLVALRAKGVSAKIQGPISHNSTDGTVGVRISAAYDRVVQRLMAKIAFNFLAAHVGPEWVLRPEFDAARSFIRLDEGSSVTRVVEQAVLAEERGMGNWSLTDHHLVGVERGTGDGVLGRVSLFNLLNHEVRLSNRYPGLVHRPDIPFARRYDWSTGEVAAVRAWEDDSLVHPVDLPRFRRGT